MSNKLNILILSIPYAVSSGINTIIPTLHKQLNIKGHRAILLNHWADFNTRKEGRTEPYELYTEKGEFHGFRSIEDFLNSPYFFRPDVIHINSHSFTDRFDGGLKRILEKSGNPPTVYTLHEITLFKFLDDYRDVVFTTNNFGAYMADVNNRIRPWWAKDMTWEYGFLEGQEDMIKIADKLITISSYDMKVFHKIYPQYSHKAVQVNNGTIFMRNSKNKWVAQKAQELRSKYAPHGEKLILYVGRISTEKGIDDLANAFNEIAQNHHNVKLVIVGNRNEDQANAVKRFINSSFHNRVIFGGWIDSSNETGERLVAAYYRMADIAIFPSHYEPFGLVIIEAMCMKTPVITTNVGAPKELFIERGIAYPIEPRNPGSIASAIEHVLSNIEETKSRTEKAYWVVMREYSMKNYLEKMIEVFENASDGTYTNKKGEHTSVNVDTVIARIRSRQPRVRAETVISNISRNKNSSEIDVQSVISNLKRKAKVS